MKRGCQGNMRNTWRLLVESRTGLNHLAWKRAHMFLCVCVVFFFFVWVPLGMCNFVGELALSYWGPKKKKKKWSIENDVATPNDCMHGCTPTLRSGNKALCLKWNRSPLETHTHVHARARTYTPLQTWAHAHVKWASFLCGIRVSVFFSFS